MCSSKVDVESQAKENVNPNTVIVKKAKLGPVVRATLMMPISDDRTCSAVQLPSADLHSSRYLGLNKLSPFFSYQYLRDVTYECEQIKTIEFCQLHGLIAKSITCENCGAEIMKPTYQK